MFNGGRDALVMTEQLIGPETAITSVVLTFNQPLNAVSADNPNAYGIVRKVNETNQDSSGILGSLTRSAAATRPLPNRSFPSTSGSCRPSMTPPR